MVDKLIPPRRDEVLTEKGVGSIRTMEYLERNAEQTNESTEATEADPSSVDLSSAQSAAISKQVSAILNEIQTSESAIIAKLQKRIEELENTFVAPFYKTKYDKLKIKIADVDELRLPLNNDAADPTVQFGDGDTGFYEESDDVLAVSVGSVKRFSYRALDFRAEFTANTGAAMRFVTPTATVPGFAPNVSDTDTGIGWAGANLLALISGGVEGLRVSATAITVPTGTWDNTGINIASGDTYKINGTTVLSNNSLGSGVTASSLTSVGTLISVNTSGVYSVDGTQVVSNQGAAVSDASGGATIDAEARAAINALLARVRAHGLIS